MQRLSTQRGFTLIELVITFVIIAILTTLAAPSFFDMIRNGQIRSAAESLQNALRTAQVEATTRNRQVEFFLSDTVPSSTTNGTSSGRYWGAKALGLTDADNPELIRQGVLFNDTAPIQVEAGGVSKVLTFNSLGRLVGATADPQWDIQSAANGNSTRHFRVTVSLGGQIRMCDADKSIADAPDGC